MSNKKLVGIVAVAGALLVGGSSAVAVASDGDSPDDVRQVRQSADPGQERHYDVRGDRGNPWPEHCTTEDPAVDAKQAERIALREVPGAQVTEIDLDRCYGMEWEIDLREGNTEHEIEINADNGQIISAEQDEDDD